MVESCYQFQQDKQIILSYKKFKLKKKMY